MNDGIKKCVSLCILECDDKYLLIRRGKSKNKKEDDCGLYLPIGGKLDSYETPEEAAKREVFEEAGYTINNLEFKGMVIETSKAEYNWVDFIFLSKVSYFEPKETDEGYLEWIPKDKIEQLPMPEIDKVAYKYLLNNQKFIFNDQYDENLNLLYSKEEISGKIIVDRR